MCFKRCRAVRGFSLVEMMIVIVIIGLLAGLVTVNVRSYLSKAQQNAAKSDISVIMQTLDFFWTEYNRYPTNEEGLDVLAKSTDMHPEPFLTKLPIDPWGRPYLYICPGVAGSYDVFCLGADGREGGTGADKDITDDDLQRERRQ